MTAATPACSKARAKPGAVSDSSSQPSRILTVTGMLTALTTADTRSTARSTWHMSAEPPPLLTTFLTGQPMLISTAEAPCSSTQRAACSISAIDDPVDLDRERAVLLAGLGQLEGPAPFLDQRPGVDQVRRRQAESTAFSNGQPECQAGVAGQRRQEEPRGDRHLAQSQRLAHNRWDCGHRTLHGVPTRPTPRQDPSHATAVSL